jgi:hypothetical protein
MGERPGRAAQGGHSPTSSTSSPTLGRRSPRHERRENLESITSVERFGKSVAPSSAANTVFGLDEGARLFTRSGSTWMEQAGAFACSGAEGCDVALAEMRARCSSRRRRTWTRQVTSDLVVATGVRELFD